MSPPDQAPADNAHWPSNEPDPHDLMRPLPAEPMRLRGLRESRRSTRSEYGLAATTQRQILGASLALIDHLDVSAGWSIPAELDHGKNDFFGPRKQRLDAAVVAAVAHPAFDPEFEGGDFGPGAKAYALHATTDDDLEDHVHSKSRTRVGQRCLERSQINADLA